jgi:hypothetical protein
VWLRNGRGGKRAASSHLERGISLPATVIAGKFKFVLSKQPWPAHVQSSTVSYSYAGYLFATLPHIHMPCM